MKGVEDIPLEVKRISRVRVGANEAALSTFDNSPFFLRGIDICSVKQFRIIQRTAKITSCRLISYFSNHSTFPCHYLNSTGNSINSWLPPATGIKFFPLMLISRRINKNAQRRTRHAKFCPASWALR